MLFIFSFAINKVKFPTYNLKEYQINTEPIITILGSLLYKIKTSKNFKNNIKLVRILCGPPQYKSKLNWKFSTLTNLWHDQG